MHEWVWKTALNAKTKEKKWLKKKAWMSVPNGSERHNGGKWWWTEWKIYMRILSVELRTNEGSEHQNEDTTLKA